MYPSLMRPPPTGYNCDRYEREAQTLASLTKRNIGDIRTRMNIASWPTGDEKPWDQRLWVN